MSDAHPPLPDRPLFSSGPCAKPARWRCCDVAQHTLGRSHRSDAGLALIQDVLAKIRQLLNVPTGYEIALVPGSATGACEMALWNLLGPRPVDVFAWDVFGHKWLSGIRDQLRLVHRAFTAPSGALPDLSAYQGDHDCCFVWLGTSCGVHVPHTDWIPAMREGLVICDATSAAFSFEPPWEKLDAVAFSLQKVLGSEGGHGVLVLSPRALERLRHYTPAWPLPSLLRLGYTDPAGARQICTDLFIGKTHNTPSLWCMADASYCLDGLSEIGGVQGAAQRSQENADVLASWVAQRDWIAFCVKDPLIRSPLVAMLVPTHSRFTQGETSQQWQILSEFCARVAAYGAGYDIKGHAQAPPALRIWCGPTIETPDLARLLVWLDHVAREVGLAA